MKSTNFQKSFFEYFPRIEKISKIGYINVALSLFCEIPWHYFCISRTLWMPRKFQKTIEFAISVAKNIIGELFPVTIKHARGKMLVKNWFPFPPKNEFFRQRRLTMRIWTIHLKTGLNQLIHHMIWILLWPYMKRGEVIQMFYVCDVVQPWAILPMLRDTLLICILLDAWNDPSRYILVFLMWKERILCFITNYTNTYVDTTILIIFM